METSSRLEFFSKPFFFFSFFFTKVFSRRVSRLRFIVSISKRHNIKSHESAFSIAGVIYTYAGPVGLHYSLAVCPEGL